MSILIDKNTRVLVQGITGRQAHLNTIYMKAYGTKIVAGVTPGKGGMAVEGTPVYHSVREAVGHHPEINAALLYVPPGNLKKAAIESVEAGIPLLIITTERCPQQDVMEVIALSRQRKVRVVGPNSIGIITPGECVTGLIGARVDLANECFHPGRIGVISRSGGQTSTVCFYLSRAGFGQSTAVGIGGDPFNGATFRDLLELFQEDKHTDAVVAFGEVGTYMEEEMADFIAEKGFTKPFICYVAGRFVEEGVRYGHAGALISKGLGGVEAKLSRLRRSGAVVLDHLDDVASEVSRILG